VHGAKSPRKIAPLAAEIEQEARALPTWPAYLNEPTYAAAVVAWARSEAVCEVLWRWLAEQDVLAWLTEQTDGEETTDQPTPTRTRKISHSRRVASALDQLATWQTRAANHRSRLGLDPLSRARLGRDVAAGELDAAQLLTKLREAAERDGGAA
jgi:hypothetical protein